MENKLNSEEKIDYIYETLKKQESRALKATIFKWGFRIFILLYIIYFIKVGLPLLIDSMIPAMPSFWTEDWMNTDALREALNRYLN